MSTLSIPKIEVSQEEIRLATEINSISPIVKVETEGEYTSAVTFLGLLKDKENAVHEFFDEDVSRAYELHRSLTGKRKKFLDAIQAIRAKVDSLCSGFRRRKEEERQAEERRLQEESLKKQQDELLAEAAMLEKTGDVLGAASVLAEAQNSPAPVVVVQSQVPKVSGSYVKENWKFRIKNADLIPDEFWVIDEQAIAAIVRAKKKSAERLIPGIEVYSETSTITKR